MRNLLRLLFIRAKPPTAPWCPSCQEPHYLALNKMNWKRC